MIDRLSVLIQPILEGLGMELVEMAIVGGKRNPIVRVYIYKPDGVNIDDCAAISRPFSLELDSADLFESSYTVEVSSPGMDRPLATPDDFRRRQGFLVRVKLKDMKKPVVGTIQYTDKELILQTADGESKIAYDNVEKGLLEF